MNVKEENGFTLIEVILTVLIVALLSGMAVVSGVGLVTRARVSKSTAQLADNLSLSRERAMAQYQRWMLTFPVPSGGADTVMFYEISACDLSLHACDPTNPADWESGPGATVYAESGIGFQVLQPLPQPVQIVFDRTGRNLAAVDVDIRICLTVASASGTVSCRSGGAANSIRIRKVSGIVQPLP
jgi:prepilin-type N-terminal cleavage/methylation domain-containing protein